MDANKNKPPAGPPEPKPKKPKRERPPEKPVVIPPAVWLGLLLVPFLYLLVQYVFQDDPPPQPQPEAAPASVQQADSPVPAKEAPVGRWGGRGGAVAPPEEIISMDKLKACDFDDWVGKPLPRPLLKRHMLPYRVIVPGSGTGKVPPGGSPLVLNIEVDRQEIVTKVWCG